MADPAVKFLKEFVSNPQEIGAIVPSSPALVKEIVNGIDWSKVKVLVEYGPGLGAITKGLLKKVEGRDFFVIELNETYADAFAEKFPDVTLYRNSVANIVKICEEHGVEAIDCVVSGLPWTNFSDELQDELLDAMMEALALNGQFATFAYMHGLALPSARRFAEKLNERFGSVERSNVVWRNAPPAIVYRCRR